MLRALFTALIGLLALASCGDSPVDSDGRAYYIEAPDQSRKLRVSWYGPSIVRLQTAENGEPFLPDDHYGMVESHNWPGDVNVDVTDQTVVFTSSDVALVIDRESLLASFRQDANGTPVLREQGGDASNSDVRITRFEPDDAERFTGLGHGYFARADRLELTGDVIERNYGSVPIEQAPLIVPFYLSSFGYGVFLNSMFPNRFAMNADGDYSMAIDTHGFTGQMDYFFIAGPGLVDVLDRYTQLTGRRDCR